MCDLLPYQIRRIKNRNDGTITSNGGTNESGNAGQVIAQCLYHDVLTADNVINGDCHFVITSSNQQQRLCRCEGIFVFGTKLQVAGHLFQLHRAVAQVNDGLASDDADVGRIESQDLLNRLHGNRKREAIGFNQQGT